MPTLPETTSELVPHALMPLAAPASPRSAIPPVPLLSQPAAAIPPVPSRVLLAPASAAPSVLPLSSPRTERLPCSPAPLGDSKGASSRDVLEPLSAQRYRIQFTA